MTYRYEPALRLRSGDAVQDLDQAAEIVRRHARDHADTAAERILHHIEGAVGADEERAAAMAFRGWAESAGLVDIPLK